MNTHETNQHTPPPLSEVKKMRPPVHNAILKYKKDFTSVEKFAVWITEGIGSMGFFCIIFIWTLIWLSWNLFAPSQFQFDPYPAFVLWLFISNVIQMFFLPLIMVGQNLQGRYAEARAEEDFKINTKAEREVEVILMHLEKQEKVLNQIISRLESRG